MATIFEIFTGFPGIYLRSISARLIREMCLVQ